MNKLRILKYTIHFSLLVILFSNNLIGKDLKEGKNNFSPSHLPTFENFPSEKVYKGKIASVKLNSYPEAGRYRTRLREGVKTGPNFAGHYIVIPIGCGTNCQNQWVVNVKTGKVLARYLTTLDAEYRVGSSLLILNAPTEEYKKLYKENPKSADLAGKTTYVVWEKDKPRVIYQEDIVNLLKSKDDDH